MFAIFVCSYKDFISPLIPELILFSDFFFEINPEIGSNLLPAHSCSLIANFFHDPFLFDNLNFWQYITNWSRQAVKS